MEDKIRRTEIREQSDGSDDSASEFPKDTSPSPAPTKPSRYMRPSKYDNIRETEPEEPLFEFDEEDPMETVKKILKKYRNKVGAFFEIF